MANVIIIGKGPAGVSAALYITRAGIDTTIIGKDFGALSKAHEIENYYGFSEPISGTKLVETGLQGALRLGTNLIEDEVFGLSYDGSFIIQTKTSEYKADCVIIASGSSRTSPMIKGLKELEGHGVSYCAVCDAFFYRGKDVSVLGHGEYALHEAMELLPIAGSVTLLTNGMKPEIKIPESIKLLETPIESLNGTSHLESISFSDGTSIDTSGLFVAVGVAGSTALAKKIGAPTDKNHIIVDSNMSTNIPGLYAAGDCTGGLLQISKAVYEGAKAGTEVIKYIRSKG